MHDFERPHRKRVEWPLFELSLRQDKRDTPIHSVQQDGDRVGDFSPRLGEQQSFLSNFV